MKCFIVVIAFALIACVSASGRASSGVQNGLVSTGSSTQFRSEDNLGNYQFGYDESHSGGSTSRHEEQRNGVTRGSYSLSDADGRRRTVHYMADASGFHAIVTTNEPGVEAKNPADVQINKEEVDQTFEVQTQAPVAPANRGPALVTPTSRSHEHSSGPAAPVQFGRRLQRYSTRQQNYEQHGQQQHEQQQHEQQQHEQQQHEQQQHEQQEPETPTPRAFRYSFATTHTVPAVASNAPAHVRSAPKVSQRKWAY